MMLTRKRRTQRIDANIGRRFTTVREDGILEYRDVYRNLMADLAHRGLIHSTGMVVAAIRRSYTKMARRVADKYARIMFEEHRNARFGPVTQADVDRMLNDLQRLQQGMSDELWVYTTSQIKMLVNEEGHREQIESWVAQAFLPAKRYVKAEAESQKIGLLPRLVRWLFSKLPIGW